MGCWGSFGGPTRGQYHHEVCTMRGEEDSYIWPECGRSWQVIGAINSAALERFSGMPEDS